MPYFTPPGGPMLFFSDDGDGPALILLHGWTCDGTDWIWLSADLKVDHRVIVLDQRGHGRSGLPDDADYRPTTMAEDAYALMQHCGVARAVVIGHSMGTIVASALAVEHPDAVASLVLVDPVYRAEDEVLGQTIPLIQSAPIETASRFFEAFYVSSTPTFLPVLHKRRLEATDPFAVGAVVAAVYQGDMALGRRVVSEHYLPRRTCPIFAIYAHGGEPAIEWEYTLDDRSVNRFEVWPEAGHFLHQEQPERFAAAVRQWLGSKSTGSAGNEV